MKTCNNVNCKQTNPQPLEAFFNDKVTKDGKYSICKACKTESTLRWRDGKKKEYNAYMREYRKTHPEKYNLGRARSLRNRYGITQDDYDKMLARQNGTCAICPAKPSKRPFHVDHCHKSGRVRGLLCASHNRSIAILDDDILLERAISYVLNSKLTYSGTGCDRCQQNDEPYMFTEAVWRACTDNTKEDYLCLSCAKLRLGRPLRLSDFSDAPINFGSLGFDCREYVKKVA